MDREASQLGDFYSSHLSPLIASYPNNGVKIMKYITSSFSMLMFQEPSLLFKREILTEEEFMKETEDAYSCIGAEDVAKHLGYAYNKETVKARSHDTIYNATIENGEYKYFKISVMPSTVLDGIYCEELL